MPKKPNQEYVDDFLNQKPKTWKGKLPETWLGGAEAAADVGLGIWGLFNDATLDVQPYKSEYETSNTLEGLRNAALQKAFTGGDDFASRIRVKNNYDQNVMDAIGRSGGSRGFVTANSVAAGDVFNLANLGIDQQQGQQQLQKLSLAQQLEQAVMNDSLNKIQDKRYENEDVFRKGMTNLNLQRENDRGAWGLIRGGLNMVPELMSNERLWGEDGTMNSVMKARLGLEASKMYDPSLSFDFMQDPTPPRAPDQEAVFTPSDKYKNVWAGFN